MRMGKPHLLTEPAKKTAEMARRPSVQISQRQMRTLPLAEERPPVASPPGGAGT